MTGYLMNQVEKNTKGFIVYVCNTVIDYVFEYNITEGALNLIIYCLEGAFSKEVSFYKSFKPFSDDYSLDLFT